MLRPIRVAALASLVVVVATCAAVKANADDLHLIPRPRSVALAAGCALSAGSVLGALSTRDAGGFAVVRERWTALGIHARRGSSTMDVAVATPGAPRGSQAYTLSVDERGVRVAAADAEGAFDAYATLAQLARRDGERWSVPCVRIDDAPALRWRILSDDVSRGPLPTMRYFQERIRTIASFKMNGYSPYMEHVFIDRRHPLPAPLDGITPDELRQLAAYAARFHVALIPEQQTFAHMHETLKWERYAALAELPHGYLLAPANAAGAAYARDLIADELAAVPRPPFFHIGSDEPSDLGRGRSQALVAAEGDGRVYAQHVIDTANFVIARGARPMVWDDAVAKHPEIFAALPKPLVFVNWHYGTEATYRPYIERIAHAGFDQMVAPGALNWNEIYPDLDRALGNIDRFVTEGKAAHVLGLFQTVWHDDGETLFEATWYPVLYAAASAWEEAPVERERYARDFPMAFFGSGDARYADDVAALGRCRTLLERNPREYGDYLFWSDPFAPDLANVGAIVDVPALRLAAESVLEHLRLAPPPPLHPNAAAVMSLAARRYDTLGRGLQIATETRDYYGSARTDFAAHRDGFTYRDLLVTKYLFWERRDALLALEPLVRASWEYENRASHEASVLERYRAAADLAIARADRIDAIVYRDYVAKKALPPFETALGLEAQSP